MLIKPPVNVKPLLFDLVCNSIPNLGPKHECAAPHVIVHDVFQSRLKCLLMDRVEENLLVGGHLNSNVTLDVIDHAANLNGVVHFPLSSIGIFIHHNLEEKNFVGAFSNQSLVVD